MTYKYILCDIETTGLDPKNDFICEFGMCIVDPAKDWEVTNRYSAVVSDRDLYGFVKVMASAGNFVGLMHQKSGLLEDLRDASGVGPNLDTIEKQAIKFLADNKIDPNEGILVGSSIHFDRSFIQNHMPLLDDYLFYRMMDVTSFKLLADIKMPELGKRVPQKADSRHRVLPDMEDSLKELKLYLPYMFEKAQTFPKFQPPKPTPEAAKYLKHKASMICEHCGTQILTMAFKGTGFCSIDCSKAHAALLGIPHA